MDPRRNNGHNGGSRMMGTRMQVMKTTSDISFAPNQTAMNARKNPLDGPSRTSLGYQSVEKRSGLQNTTHIKPKAYPKGSITEGVPPMSPQGNCRQQLGHGMPQQPLTFMPANGGFAQMQQPHNHQMYQPAQQLQSVQQGVYAAPQSYGQGQAQNQGHLHQMASLSPQSQYQMAPNQDPYMQMQAAPQAYYSSQPQSTQNMGHFQQQQQFQAQQQQLAQHQQLMAQQNANIQAHQSHAHAQANAQAQALAQMQGGAQPQVRAHHGHGRSRPAHNNQSYNEPHASVGGGDPSMCTTCPNCQTTIYIRENGADGYEFQNPYEQVYGSGQSMAGQRN